jgi:hypothetical protein
MQVRRQLTILIQCDLFCLAFLFEILQTEYIFLESHPVLPCMTVWVSWFIAVQVKLAVSTAVSLNTDDI